MDAPQQDSWPKFRSINEVNFVYAELSYAVRNEIVRTHKSGADKFVAEHLLSRHLKMQIDWHANEEDDDAPFALEPNLRYKMRLQHKHKPNKTALRLSNFYGTQLSQLLSSLKEDEERDVMADTAIMNFLIDYRNKIRRKLTKERQKNHRLWKGFEAFGQENLFEKIPDDDLDIEQEVNDSVDTKIFQGENKHNLNKIYRDIRIGVIGSHS